MIFYHSGPVSLVTATLTVTDGKFPAEKVQLNIPVQRLSLQSSQNQASPISIQQGNNVMTLTVMNLPCSTNGRVSRLSYNITRFPLHGKILLRDRNTVTPEFTHFDLLKGICFIAEVIYIFSQEHFVQRISVP